MVVRTTAGAAPGSVVVVRARAVTSNAYVAPGSGWNATLTVSGSQPASATSPNANATRAARDTA